MLIMALLFAAMGNMVYGGPLHSLLAGSFFAGSGVVDGVGLCNGYPTITVEKHASTYAELYYVNHGVLTKIRDYISRNGYHFKEIRVNLKIHNYVVKALTYTIECEPSSIGENTSRPYRRTLIAIPPRSPPPQQPLTVIPAIITGASPCRNDTVFCKSYTGHWEGAIADVYVSIRLLAEWLREIDASLEATTATTTYGFTVYTYLPISVNEVEEKT